MKKVYEKPEIEQIDLSAKELFMNTDPLDLLGRLENNDDAIGTSIIEDDWF